MEEPKRKNFTYRLDERLVESLKKEAKRLNISANRLIENYLVQCLSVTNALDEKYEPLGETRGKKAND